MGKRHGLNTFCFLPSQEKRAFSQFLAFVQTNIIVRRTGKKGKWTRERLSKSATRAHRNNDDHDGMTLFCQICHTILGGLEAKEIKKPHRNTNKDIFL